MEGSGGGFVQEQSREQQGSSERRRGEARRLQRWGVDGAAAAAVGCWKRRRRTFLGWTFLEEELEFLDLGLDY